MPSFQVTIELSFLGYNFLYSLQCITPIVEGILPGVYNFHLLDVIFEFQQWHSLAKLRLHTDKTMKIFEEATISLGNTICEFQQTTCKVYAMVELPSEEAARGQHQAALVTQQGKKTMRTATTTTTGSAKQHITTQRKIKTLNLETYKWHALGDHPGVIKEHGTSDNTTTQTVSLSTILTYVVR